MNELRVSHLEVHYGDLIGVADVSLRVEEGAIVALLGSNGSGKTTTLNAIAGLVQPSGAINSPAPFPAASGKCWRSAAR